MPIQVVPMFCTWQLPYAFCYFLIAETVRCSYVTQFDLQYIHMIWHQRVKISQNTDGLTQQSITRKQMVWHKTSKISGEIIS